MLFSATFKRRVERLAQEALRDPVKIIVGSMGQANEDIRQEVVLLKVREEGGREEEEEESCLHCHCCLWCCYDARIPLYYYCFTNIMI